MRANRMTAKEMQLAMCAFKLSLELGVRECAVLARQMSLELATEIVRDWAREPEMWDNVDDLRVAALVRLRASGKEFQSSNPNYYSLYKYMNWAIAMVGRSEIIKEYARIAEQEPRYKVQEMVKPLGDRMAEKLASMQLGPKMYPYTWRDIRMVPDNLVMTIEEMMSEGYDPAQVAKLKLAWLQAGNRVRNAGNPAGKLPSELEIVAGDRVYAPGDIPLLPGEELKSYMAQFGLVVEGDKPAAADEAFAQSAFAPAASMDEGAEELRDETEHLGGE